MALTVTQLADFVRLTLGGRADAALPTLLLTNMAGRHLVTMSRWKWLERAPVAVATVADQTYIEPPSDFHEPIALVGTGTSNYYRWGTIEEVTALRHNTDATWNSGAFVGAVMHVAASGSTPPSIQIQVYPTPGASTADAFRLAYRATWTDLTLDTDYMPFPSYCDTLMIRLVQEHARGFMEEDKATLSERIAAAKKWPEFEAAVRADRARQVDFGALRTELTDNEYGYPWRWPFSTITGP